MRQIIQNKQGLDIVVVVENYDKPLRLAFVMHGLGGNKDQGHIRAMIEGFVESSYTVVSFDTTNTFGESGGDYADATVTNYYSDLEDVIEWSKDQTWYGAPFVLCGHSLGAISIAWYAEQNPAEVRALAPIATVVSGRLSYDLAKTYKGEENVDNWHRQGYRLTYSNDGKIKKNLKWSHMEDRLKYDLLPHADLLTMPVLMVVGSHDDRTPPAHQRMLYDALPGPKELHIIEGAEHSFYKATERQELKQIFQDWLSKF